MGAADRPVPGSVSEMPPGSVLMSTALSAPAGGKEPASENRVAAIRCMGSTAE
jgi:hypothetical protein